MRNKFPIFIRAVILLVTFCASMQPASAETNEKVLSIDAIDSAIELTSYINIFEDSSKALTLENLSQPDSPHKFIALSTAANFGFSESAWWVKLRVENKHTQSQKITIRQNYPLIDYVDFYAQREDGSWLTYSTGDRRPFASRPIRFKEFLFPISLPANKETVIFIRFESSGPVNIGLELHSEFSLFEEVSTNHFLTGIYYGGFLILVIYNLLLFMAVRDITFFYYLLYLTSYGLFFAVMNGVAFQYFWPENTWLANQSLIILLSLSLIWSMQFSRSILSIREIAPTANKITVGLMAISLITLIVSPYVAYKTIIIPISIITLLCTIQLMAMGFIAFAKGSKPARYYLLAWTALLVGIFAYMLKTFGLLPHNTLTHNAQQIGSLIEMVLLSIAMGSKVSELKKGNYIDALTNLSNRRFFDERFSREFDQLSGKSGNPLSIAIIDVDNFKLYNDKYGHQQGDEALIFLGKKLREIARKNTIPCRYGGEEFAVILPNTSSDQANVIAERIRSSIENDNVNHHSVTVSIGLATFEGENFSSHHFLFEAADQALYSAKEKGRNRVESYQPDQPSRRAQAELAT